MRPASWKGSKRCGICSTWTGKDLFTREIDEALRDRRIDLGVHSAKDLPSRLPEGLALAAVPPREDPSDVVVSRDGGNLLALPAGSRVGTSSPRRRAQILSARPDLEVVPARGNVDTRIRRLRENEDRDLRELVAGIDHPPSHREVLAERAVLDVLEAGCRAPVAGLARTETTNLQLQAAVFSPDGSRTLREEAVGPAECPEDLGREVGERLLARGAAELIAIVRAAT